MENLGASYHKPAATKRKREEKARPLEVSRSLKGMGSLFFVEGREDIFIEQRTYFNRSSPQSSRILCDPQLFLAAKSHYIDSGGISAR